jgi:DNA-directed RNA polymerase specialized sigma24 family protein
VSLETTLDRATPTGAQWVAWTQQEPALADLAYQDMRWQLRTASPARKDELFRALVRLVQTDPGAFGVLAACLLPALRHRVTQHAPSLDRHDALAVIAAGLYEAAVRYDVEAHPRFVAEKLLALPTRRLRRAVALHRRWNAHARHPVDGVSHAAGPELSPRVLLAEAVYAGVLAEHEARLILDTRVDGRTLPEVADELGLSYEAAKKRRRRAEARWAAWWLRDMGRVGGPGTGEGAA